MQPDGESSQLPFFVYGTLLPGQPNAHLWGDAVEQWQPALLRPAHLYSLGAYPMLVEADEGAVQGMIATVQPERYDVVLRELDALERYDPNWPDRGPYRRRTRPATLEDGSHRPVWVYLGSPRLVRGLPRIPDGDWAAHAARHTSRLRDWWNRHRHDYHRRPPGDLS